VRAFEAALRATGARGAIVASMPENLPEEHAAELFRRGIVPLHGIVEAMEAAEAAAFIGERWSAAVAQPIATADMFKAPPPPARGRGTQTAEAAAFASGSSSPPRRGGEVARAEPETVRGAFTLDEAEAKALLIQTNLPVPPGRRASSAEEAVAASEQLGFPVAVKALGVAHKSELGAVRLNLKSAEEVRAAAVALLTLGTGLYVERMVQRGVAELIVGFTRDPIFGPVVTIGTGGVLVELLRDSATLMLPATREDIEAELRGLKLFPLLDGYRGRPKADLDAAIEAILGIAAFVLENADRVEELDINPLIVCGEGKGAWIADALMIVAPSPLVGEGVARGLAEQGRDKPTDEGCGTNCTPQSFQHPSSDLASLGHLLPRGEKGVPSRRNFHDLSDYYPQRRWRLRSHAGPSEGQRH
jgi:acyl-CoA synthetase (NDP forming)